jgi:hypothetical protein
LQTYFCAEKEGVNKVLDRRQSEGQIVEVSSPITGKDDAGQVFLTRFEGSINLSLGADVELSKRNVGLILRDACLAGSETTGLHLILTSVSVINVGNGRPAATTVVIEKLVGLMPARI